MIHFSGKTWNAIELSLRTSWTTFLCLFIFQYWTWAGKLAFVSPLISILSSTMYLGSWQESCFKVIYSTIIGAGVGIIAGKAYPNKLLQFFLLFITLSWINRIPHWDRLSMVIGSLALILGSVLPNISKQPMTSLKTFELLLGLLIIPYLITGLAILFPKPGLAIYAAKDNIHKTNSLFRKALQCALLAFSKPNHVDLLTIECDEIIQEIRTKQLPELSALVTNISYECIIFHQVNKMPIAINHYIDSLKLILTELSGLNRILKNIAYNQTQNQFIEYLQDHMDQLLHEIDSESLFSMMDLYFDTFQPFPLIINQCYHSFFNLCSTIFKPFERLCYRNNTLNKKTDSNASPDYEPVTNNVSKEEGDIEMPKKRNRSMTLSQGFHQYFLTLTDFETIQTQVMNRLQQLQGQFNPIGVDESNQDLENKESFALFNNSSKNSLKQKESDLYVRFLERSNEILLWRTELLLKYNLARKKFIFFYDEKPQQKEIIKSKFQNNIYESSVSKKETMISQERVEQAYKLNDDFQQERALMSTEEKLYEENVRLSLSNINPRGAYFHRLSILIERVIAMQSILLLTEESHFSISQFLWFYFISVPCEYFVSSFSFFVHIITIIFNVFFPNNHIFYSSNVVHSNNQNGPFLNLYLELQTYFLAVYPDHRKQINGFKIALAVTLTSTLMFFNWLTISLIQNGYWATVVIALIRQDTTSSSFLFGYQRLEGTVIGAIYSYIILQSFQCGINSYITTSSSQNDSSQVIDSPSICRSDFLLIPVIVIWVAICTLFRNGVQHGYSANVASFTPIILLLGTTKTDINNAWGRIQETFIGIFVYLIVDNLIYPNRIYPAMKDSVLKSIKETKIMFTESIQAVEKLLSFEHLSIALSKRYDNILEDSSPLESPSLQEFSFLFDSDQKEDKVLIGPPNELKEMAQLYTNPTVTLLVPDNTAIRLPSEEDGTTLPRSPISVRSRENTILKEDLLKMKELFNYCKQHLEMANQQLKCLESQLTKQQSYLDLVPFEPNLWHTPFPYQTYRKLHQAFINVLRSGEALNSGAQAMNVILCQMNNHHEDIYLHIKHFAYMINRIFQIAAKAESALDNTQDAFQR